MPLIGYPEKNEYGGEDPVTGFAGPNGSLWLSNSTANQLAQRQLQQAARVGLREIAFRADSREQVDAVAKAGRGQRRQNPRRTYAESIRNMRRDEYYSVFFTDPDGLKLEVVTYNP